jgi:hypothetical protein
MASIEPPDAVYVPRLPSSLLEGRRGKAGAMWGAHPERALSAAQLEAVVYAGQRHAQSHADGTRCGFFIGDGTGVGKGREIAAIVLDNYQQGRYRHIWCSISTSLFYDARRDLNDLGRSNVPLHPLHKLAYGEVPDSDGVMICTYQSLIAENRQKESRLDQLVSWAAVTAVAFERDLPHACLCVTYDLPASSPRRSSSGDCRGIRTRPPARLPVWHL